MKKGALIVLGASALLILILWFSVIGKQNRMVELQEAINTNYGEVKNQYQRRADLIPNVIATVKGAANFEKETLQNIVDARARVGQIHIGDDVVNDPAKLAQYEQAQQELSKSVGRLLVVAENYPELKSSQLFRDLVVELEGSENRITVARKRMGDAVGTYNTYIRKFPNNLFAGIFGFEKVAYFENKPGTDEVPKVSF
jgi:LemA protein